jgi:bifunctional DNA-binding transcriptional regulator/antitoxin component of YhaV-PrlF toxin-antitoxin module
VWTNGRICLARVGRWPGWAYWRYYFWETAKSKLAHSGERLLKFEVKGKMRFKTKVQRQGHVYLPKSVRETLGYELKIIPGEHVAVLCSSDASKGEILASLQLIMQEIERFYVTEEGLNATTMVQTRQFPPFLCEVSEVSELNAMEFSRGITENFTVIVLLSGVLTFGRE